MPGSADYAPRVTVANEYTLFGTGTLYGRLTVNAAVQEVKVGANKLALRTTVTLKAHPDNAGYIYVGFDNLVTATNYGYVLSGGEGMELTLDTADALGVWVFASAATQLLAVIEGTT